MKKKKAEARWDRAKELLAVGYSNHQITKEIRKEFGIGVSHGKLKLLREEITTTTKTSLSIIPAEMLAPETPADGLTALLVHVQGEMKRLGIRKLHIDESGVDVLGWTRLELGQAE